jgi:CelD/BcsL family acetyltransferase involved in cellulose biosynthesis
MSPRRAVARHLTVVEDPARFAAIREEWTELLQNSDADNLFLTWEWLHTWWRHLGAGRKLSIVMLRSGRKLLALAPLIERPRQIWSLQLWPSLEFLGGGDVGSDYLDVIVRRGAEHDARTAFAREWHQRALMLHLPRTSNERSTVLQVMADLRRRGWTPRVARTDLCPFIPLAGETWSSYLQTLGASHRSNFRRRLRNLERSFRVDFSQAATEPERQAAFAALTALHGRRWRARGGSTAFHSERLVRFHDDLTRLLLDRGWLRLFVLSLDGTPVAALYGVLYRRKFYFYQSGFDPSFARHSVGLVAMGLSIEHAIRDGAIEYDLLHGTEPYKFLWAQHTRGLTGLELYPPDMRGSLGRTVMSLRAAAKALIRPARIPKQAPSSTRHVEPELMVPSSR